jgi:hypothetical protein
MYWRLPEKSAKADRAIVDHADEPLRPAAMPPMSPTPLPGSRRELPRSGPKIPPSRYGWENDHEPTAAAAIYQLSSFLPTR